MKIIYSNMRARDFLYKLPLHIVLGIFSIACIVPLLLVIVISLTNEMELINEGYTLFPSKLTLDAYSVVIGNPKQILTSYLVTIAVTVAGTVLSMILTASLAYVVSRKDYAYANKTSFYVFFTMLFNGGMVPWYILITKYLHMNNTIFALIIPYLVIPWFVLLMKGFFSNMPMAVIESAKIDGAGEFRTFFSIVIPINKPGLATVALFSTLMYWNDYWLSLMFITSNKLATLQFMLYRMLSNIEFLNSALALKSGVSIRTDMPNLSARMAMCILAAGPMLMIFPFFQKYFVKGLTIGAVKG